MKVGMLLLADAARVREDGTLDVAAGGQQVVFVDPEQPLMRRNIVFQLINEPKDVGTTRNVRTVLFSPDRVELVGVEMELKCQSAPGKNPQPDDVFCFNYAMPIEIATPQLGRHELSVVFDGIAQQAVPIEFVSMDELQGSYVEAPAEKVDTDGRG